MSTDEQKPDEPYTPEEMVEQLRAMRLRVPDFGVMTRPAARSLRSTSSVHAGFVQASINAIGASQEVAQAVARDADTLRAEQNDVSRWSAVETELRLLLEGIATANLTRRHRLGLTALQTYSITRQLVRQPEHGNLLPHLDEMRRTNHFGRRRRKAATDAPEPPAATHV